MRLFPDVANLPLRDPALLAKASASIDVLSGGRFELGLVALHAEHGFDGFVLWSDGDMAEQIGRLAAVVAPALRRVG